MGKYALIVDCIVVNIVLWNGLTPYNPNGELIPIGDSKVDIGYSYINGEFKEP